MPPTSPSTGANSSRFHFMPGEDLRLTDADGRELMVRIVAIIGRSALVEYRPYSKGDKKGGEKATEFVHDARQLLRTLETHND